MSLQEYEHDHRQFQAPQAGDERLFVQFYPGSVRDDDATKREGRPIFKDVDFIRIQQPGNLLSTIERPVRLPNDAQRFPRQYQAYKAGQSQEAAVGTPLSEWAGVTRGQVEELRYFKITTVEQLAEVADNVAQRIMGVQMLKQKAHDWLAGAKGKKAQQELREMREANNALLLKVEEMQKEMARMSEQLRTRK